MKLNIGNSIFEGFNDKDGLMICGYEWGYSKDDQRLDESGEEVFFVQNATSTFSNKSPVYGKRVFSWPYDNRIIKWFDIWGHPLNREGDGNDFDKCIIQTNWCDSQGNKIEESYYAKLTAPEQIENFIFHVEALRPRLIFFMGSQIIDILQDESVLPRFSSIMGKPVSSPRKIQKPFDGRRFRIGFQDFEKCKIVSLPHPSGTRGLSDNYISLFTDEIGSLLYEFRLEKGV